MPAKKVADQFLQPVKGRPKLKNTLDFVRIGDVFVVTKFDRLARSVVDLAGIVRTLEAKQVDLVVLDQGIDTTTISEWGYLAGSMNFFLI